MDRWRDFTPVPRPPTVRRMADITFAVRDLPEPGGPAIDGRTITDAIIEALGSR